MLYTTGEDVSEKFARVSVAIALHAVDRETGAIVGVTLQGADQGDTTTVAETITDGRPRIRSGGDGDGRPHARDRSSGR